MTKQILNLSTKKTNERIRHEFSESELAEMKTTVSDNMIKNYALKDELQEIKDEFKSKMQPIEKQTKRLLKSIKDRFEDVDMDVMNVPDEERMVIEFYNPETGEKVGERKMTPDERPAINFTQSVNV